VKTINDLTEHLVQALNATPGLLPAGLEFEAAYVLNGRKRQGARKKRGNAAIENLTGNDSLFVRLRPSSEGRTQASGAASRPAAVPAVPKAGPSAPVPSGDSGRGSPSEHYVEELMQALALAEVQPGHSFVSLKWFRDQFLPQQHAWAQSTSDRHTALREAIARGWILLDRLANPKNPAFPTTALRSNRAKPEVQRALGQSTAAGWGFKPIVLSGEPISETMLRDRG